MGKPTISMKPLSTTNARRNVAYFMLAMWLFALASGFANACLLEGSVDAPNMLASKLGNTSSASAASVHLEPIDHRGDDSSKAPCMKACDEGAQALQAHAEIDSIDPGFALLIAVVWEPILDTSTRHQIADSLPSWRDPPERIRYSRWAL